MYRCALWHLHNKYQLTIIFLDLTCFSIHLLIHIRSHKIECFFFNTQLTLDPTFRILIVPLIFYVDCWYRQALGRTPPRNSYEQEHLYWELRNLIVQYTILDQILPIYYCSTLKISPVHSYFSRDLGIKTFSKYSDSVNIQLVHPKDQ